MKKLKKIQVLLLLLVLCFCPSTLFSIILNIAELSARPPDEKDPLWSSYHNQRVQIRGFWYPTTSHTGVISSKPHLKSCCIGSPLLIHQQVFVHGNTATFPAERAITLEGLLKINLHYDEKNQLIQMYVLEQAHEVISPSSSLSYLVLVVLLSFLLILFFLENQAKTRLNQ